MAYELSGAERDLYDEVTDYVREEMNRADRLDEGRKVNVGFALQTLQRRLASSPEAIWQSLRRRRERLELRLKEETAPPPLPSAEDWDDYEDLDEQESGELEALVLDRATSAETVQELRAEIDTLVRLEAQALRVRNSPTNSKWQELSQMLQDPQMFFPDGTRRKIIIFSEARDTLTYLAGKIRTLLGQDEAVDLIHGGVSREARREIVERFNYSGDLRVLIANDAAGEGLNLQTANLMVNYDLPWNPNRIEQRFGRIHRIGQEEVCFLWNLVAANTREGEVYQTLLLKLDTQVRTLGGRVFDVLGQLFDGKPLRELLMDAVRYGNQPDVRALLRESVEGAVDTDAIRHLLDTRALEQTSMDTREVQLIREDMERAEARRLQPHFIQAFFLAAFTALGGSVTPREAGRFELRHVPSRLRERARELHPGASVAQRYLRVTFDKTLVRPETALPGQPDAALLFPGHPLLDAVLDLTLSSSAVLRQGSLLIDTQNRPDLHNNTVRPRLLATVRHEVRDSRPDRGQTYTVVSQRLQFIELTDLEQGGQAHDAGTAPHLDYRAPTPEEEAQAKALLATLRNWPDAEARVRSYAVTELAERHVQEVRALRLPHIAKVELEVKRRLTREINYWDGRALELAEKERGRNQPRANSQKARERAEDLHQRLEHRMESLGRERSISAGVPEVLGLALVVPLALLAPLAKGRPVQTVDAEARARVEAAAMQAVITSEISLGRQPKDVSALRGLGYDLESLDPATGRLYFIEVKGRWEGADSVTLTRNELMASRNAPDTFRLALVQVGPAGAQRPRYLSGYPFEEPGFAQVAATFHLGELLGLSREAH